MRAFAVTLLALYLGAGAAAAQSSTTQTWPSAATTGIGSTVGSAYRHGRVNHWLKIKNPAAPAVKREAEEDWSSVGKRLR